ncbi:MAG: glycosyltransferase [Bryobacterales bacterium]|nr:glycosyltransferase [Bryobacteraceae bacterium]MDW8354258.1 glycosyltransferase [Bryobacterales bacterium]
MAKAQTSLTVIIPAHNAADDLAQCLQCLFQSETPPYECLVVDDGSTDETAEVAEKLGARVLRTGGRRGPAHARNLGARAARGDVLLFLDADVCVHPDTLSRVASAFETDPELDALIGSYDDSPSSPDFLSQYRNLMHHYVHQNARREACTFWSGCGAIRREVFLAHAGFDESYGRPAIEDIELGYRLRMAGRKMVLDKHVQVKHLKRWTFWKLIKTDIFDRGIPWTELILRQHYMPNDLNLELSQRVSVALAFLLMGLSTAASLYWGWYFVAPFMGVLFLLLGACWLEPFRRHPSKGIVVAMLAILGFITWQAFAVEMAGILPPLYLAVILLFLRHRYAFSNERARKITGVLVGLYILGAIAFMVQRLPAHKLIFAVSLVASVIVILNSRFYLFLAARQGRLFALAAIPFHLLYHFYNGLSFLAGCFHYYWSRLWEKAPRPAAVAPADGKK